MERKITILSIDDEENIRFALGELFHFQGWEACSAPNVKKGLEQFRLHKPDIVLIDYHMPGINGVEGVQMLRALSHTVPIIVFTIDESQEVADQFLQGFCLEAHQGSRYYQPHQAAFTPFRTRASKTGTFGQRLK